MTLLESVVRQCLSEQQIELAGLFAGNPKCYISQLTTEHLLEAFREVTLTIVRAPSFAQRHAAPLSPLQQQILTLLGFSPRSIYGWWMFLEIRSQFKQTVSSKI
jgi:hypothetical protein